MSVFQGRKRGPGHRLTVIITTAVVDPTVQPWQAAPPVLAWVSDSGHHGLPVVIPTARGDPVFSCAHEEVPVFVPVHDCTRLFYQDKVSFQTLSCFCK